MALVCGYLEKNLFLDIPNVEINGLIKNYFGRYDYYYGKKIIKETKPLWLDKWKMFGSLKVKDRKKVFIFKVFGIEFPQSGRVILLLTLSSFHWWDYNCIIGKFIVYINPRGGNMIKDDRDFVLIPGKNMVRTRPYLTRGDIVQGITFSFKVKSILKLNE